MLDQNVLKQINKLEKEHCGTCTKIVGLSGQSKSTKVCKACPIGKEIHKLGARVEITKHQRILDKGEDMTFKDIMKLIHSSVPIVEIVEALGWSMNKYRTFMKRHGVDTSGRTLHRR